MKKKTEDKVDILELLDIKDFEDRIYNSNSRGELFHLLDYVMIAKCFKGDLSWFRGWFLEVVKFAEKNWERPESIFQHIPKMLEETLGTAAQNK